jgi:hypothetical protein
MSREAGWAPKLLPSRGGVRSWKSPGSTFGNGRWADASHQSAKLDTGASAVEMLNAECRPDAITPPARLAAVNRRLDAMLQAVKLVGDALEDFYANLSDEQKEQFEAIGPKRTAYGPSTLE